VLGVADPRVRLLRAGGPRRGPAAARNAGIRAARAPLVAFLDSDDLFLPGKLARQAELLDRLPDAGLVYTGHETFGAARGRSDEEGPELPDGFARLLRRPYFLTSSVVVRRGLLDRVGLFDESLPLAEDYDLYLRCARAAPIAGVREPLVRIRRHEGNLTAADRLRLAYLLKRVVRRHARGAEAGVPRALVMRRLAHVDYAIGALLLERGERRRALGHFARARRHRPGWVKAWKGTLIACAASMNFTRAPRH
jgi:glycosyltransferase involved in cell wall biosynthesis